MSLPGLTVTITSSSAHPVTNVWTNFGPLTTTFTPPASCNADKSNLGYVEFHISTSSGTITSWDCGQANAYIIENARCYPDSDGVAAYVTARSTEYYGAFWSPGISCPSDWWTARQQTYPAGLTIGAVDRALIGNANMDATEVFCCPRGFTVTPGGECQYRVSTTTSGGMCALQFECPKSGTTSFSTFATHVCEKSAESFSWDPSQTDTVISIYAHPIRMVHQDSDLAPSTSTPPAPLSTSTIAHANTRTRTHTHTSTHTSAHGGGGGSSSDAKVLAPAIVVPVVALIAIIAGIVFCLRYRKRKARTLAEIPYASYDNEKSSVSGGSYDAGGRAELPSPKGREL